MRQCLARGNAKDLVLPPPDSEEFIFLARRVGYTTDDWQAGARHLTDGYRAAHEADERVFSRGRSG